MRRALARAAVLTSLLGTASCSDLLGLDDYRAGTASAGAGGSGGQGQVWLDGYAARQQISIGAEKIEEDLVDFPLGVSVAPGGDLQVRAETDDGADIVFTSADGVTRLDHEIERFERSSGTLFAWVRIPVLSSSEDTKLYLYYGNPDPPAPPDRGAAWAESFGGVWHFADDTNTIPVSARDSTTHANDAVQAIATSAPTRELEGRFGPAYYFDGADDWLTAQPAGGELDIGAGSFSISMWVEPDPVPGGGFDSPWSKGGNTDPGCSIFLGADIWEVYVIDGNMVVYRALLGDQATYGSSGWVLLHLVLDRDSERLFSYVNGQQIEYVVAAAAEPIVSALPATISASGLSFHGVLDELRVHHTALTKSWIEAEHQNLTGELYKLAMPEIAP